METKEGKTAIRLRPLIEGVLKDIRSHLPSSMMAGKFHNSLSAMAVGICRKIRQQGGPERLPQRGRFSEPPALRADERGINEGGF